MEKPGLRAQGHAPLNTATSHRPLPLRGLIPKSSMHSLKFYINNNSVFAALAMENYKMPHETLNITSPCDRCSHILAEAFVLN